MNDSKNKAFLKIYRRMALISSQRNMGTSRKDYTARELKEAYRLFMQLTQEYNGYFDSFQNMIDWDDNKTLKTLCREYYFQDSKSIFFNEA